MDNLTLDISDRLIRAASAQVCTVHHNLKCLPLNLSQYLPYVYIVSSVLVFVVSDHLVRFSSHTFICLLIEAREVMMTDDLWMTL